MSNQPSGIDFPPDPPTQEMETYWRDLGRFVHQFAHVEKFLLGNLWQYSGMKLVVGQATLSGIRAKEACSLLKRVFEALNAEDSTEAKDIETLSAQLGHINDMRNALLHFGTRFREGDNFLVDNRHIAFNERRVREMPVSSAILKQMTADLEKMSDHLAVHIFQQWGRVSEFSEDFQNSLRAPWRYKPPQQAASQQKRRDKSPKRKRQP